MNRGGPDQEEGGGRNVLTVALILELTFLGMLIYRLEARKESHRRVKRLLLSS